MTTIDELLAFLRACLDDDERVARAAADGTLDWTINQPEPGAPSWRLPTLLGKSLIASCDPATLTPEEGEHIARWDPARVLAEVEAKRRLLVLHVPVDDYDPNGAVCSTCGEPGNPGDEVAVVRWPCPTVRLLAQPYAGRPGWRAEWAA